MAEIIETLYKANVNTFADETPASPISFDECQWKSFERHTEESGGGTVVIIDDVDDGGEASL